jgi:hypothetical protein
LWVFHLVGLERLQARQIDYNIFYLWCAGAP